MADLCALCGKKLSIFAQNPLRCGELMENFCGDCYDKMYDLPPARRAHLVLEQGHPADRTALQAAMERWETRQAEQAKALYSGLTCLRCGGAMLCRGRQQFKLGEETFFFSDINRLASGSMTLDVLQCASCGKLEFFAPGFLPED